MTPDYRDALQELHTSIQLYTGQNPAAADVHPAELTRRLMDAMAASAAALAQPEPVGATDEELSRRFRVWWHDEGSGLPPLPGMDHKEHVRRISEIAWANGAYVVRYGTPTNALPTPEAQ